MVRAAGTACILALLWAAGAATAPQEEPTPTAQPVGGLAFKEEVQVTVVNVPVYVTDKQGNPVTDLTAEDFRILQDGQERPLSHFQLYTKESVRDHYQEPAPPTVLTRPTAHEVASVPPAGIRPSFMTIYVDHENLRPLDRNRVLNQLTSFVRDNCRPPVQMMVASYNRSLVINQEFTSDADLIVRTLRGMLRTTGGRTSRDDDRKEIFESMARARQNAQSSVSTGAGMGQDDYRTVLGQVDSFAEEEVNSLQFTIGSLREMIGMIGGLPGKKSILYISNGLPMSPGLGMYYGMANTYGDTSLITQASRFNEYRLFDSLVAQANAQGVTFYTIGAGGLEVVGMSTAQYATPQDTVAATMDHDNYLNSIRHMAEGTGGVAIVNTNDIEEAMQRVAHDFYTYYSLGYTLHMTGSDRVHKVEVEIPGHPEYRLRYRQRFVEKSLPSRVQERVLTGLMFRLDENPMQIACETGPPAAASETRWMVPFEVSFPLDSVALFPQGDDYVGNITIFIAARDQKGQQSDVVRQEHEVRIPAARYQEARGERFTVATNLLMEKGTYRVAVGVLDAVTRQASYETLSATVGS